MWICYPFLFAYHPILDYICTINQYTSKYMNKSQDIKETISKSFYDMTDSERYDYYQKEVEELEETISTIEKMTESEAQEYLNADNESKNEILQNLKEDLETAIQNRDEYAQDDDDYDDYDDEPPLPASWFL